MTTAMYAAFPPGRRAVGGRLRGALLGLAAAGPAVAVLAFIAAEHAFDGGS